MQEKQNPFTVTFEKDKFFKTLNIATVVFATLFYICSAWFDSIWFDEAFTVGAVSNGFSRMVELLVYDVHPHFYYIVLKLWSFIFGESVIALRLFSAVLGVLCVSLGYTHIRKDFGEEVGFWFGFLTLFTFSTLKYSQQIRMYTLAIYLITLAAVYTYRRIKQGGTKNRVLALTFSVLAAYTQYFAFFIIAMMNLFLLVRAIRKKELLSWVTDAGIQFGAYAAGLWVFILQIKQGGADWLTVDYPDAIFDTFTHVFTGSPLSDIFEYGSAVYNLVGLVCTLIFTGGFFRLRLKYRENKGEYEAALLSAGLSLAVMAFTLAVSFIRPIYYVRYAVCFKGLWVFAAAVLITGIEKKAVKAIIAFILIIAFLISAVPFWKENYSDGNIPYDEQIDVREGDIFITDSFHAFVCTVNFPNNEVIFNNLWSWPVDPTYLTFGENTVISEDISQYDGHIGRIWICGDETFKYFESRSDVTLLEDLWLHTDYYDYNLHFRLYERKS